MHPRICGWGPKDPSVTDLELVVTQVSKKKENMCALVGRQTPEVGWALAGRWKELDSGRSVSQKDLKLEAPPTQQSALLEAHSAGLCRLWAHLPHFGGTTYRNHAPEGNL